MSNQPNNQDDLEPAEEFDLGFDDQPNADIKNNPLLKIGAVAGGFVLIVIAIFYFGGSGQQAKAPPSEIAMGTGDATGGADAKPSEQYKEAVEEVNRQEYEAARETGGSVVIPRNIDPLNTSAQVTIPEPKEDPAERFRQIQDEYKRQQEAEQMRVQAQQSADNAAAEQQLIQQRAQSMGSYLTSIASARTPPGMNEADAGFSLPQSQMADASYGGATSGGVIQTASAAQTAAVAPKILIPAAKIEYGQLIIEANSDAPGPVLAMIGSGKLSGSRLLGSFQKTDRYLTLNFTQLVTKKGESIPVQAIAIDPGSTLPGVVTEIDHRYFERYIIPAAAKFISGVGSALAETQTATTQSDSSTTTSSNDPDFSEAIAEGISESFDGVADALDDQASKVQVMIRVAAGTPIGILFTQAVTDQSASDAAAAAQQQAAANGTLSQSQMLQLLQLQQQGYGTQGYMPAQPSAMNPLAVGLQSGFNAAATGATNTLIQSAAPK